MVKNKLPAKISALILTGIICLSSLLTSTYATSNQPLVKDEYHLLVISDIHLGSQKVMELAPSNFNPENDLDIESFKMLLGNINSLITNHQTHPDSILLLGDSVDHITGSVTGTATARADVLRQSFSELLQISNNHKIAMSYVFGNNDSLEGDYQPFSSSLNDTPYNVARSAGWEGGHSSASSSCHLNANNSYPCTIIESENPVEGYYSAYLQPHLRLLGMNSVIFNSRANCGSACQHEFDWLQHELALAKINNDSVIIAMHIPPGLDANKDKPFWKPESLNSFMQVIKPYSELVTGVLVGHTHMEELRIIKFEGKSSIPVIFTAGLSTSHGNAPSLKEVTFAWDSSNARWSLSNYETFFYSDNRFTTLYRFQSAYCPTSVNHSINECIDRLMTDRKMQFILDTINLYYTAGNPNYHINIKIEDPSKLLITEAA